MKKVHNGSKKNNKGRPNKAAFAFNEVNIFSKRNNFISTEKSEIPSRSKQIFVGKRTSNISID